MNLVNEDQVVKQGDNADLSGRETISGDAPGQHGANDMQHEQIQQDDELKQELKTTKREANNKQDEDDQLKQQLKMTEGTNNTQDEDDKLKQESKPTRTTSMGLQPVVMRQSRGVAGGVDHVKPSSSLEDEEKAGYIKEKSQMDLQYKSQDQGQSQQSVSPEAELPSPLPSPSPRVPAVPGAFPHRGIDYRPPSWDGDISGSFSPEESSPSPLPPTRSNNPDATLEQHNNHGLVTANVVSSSEFHDRDMEEAVPVQQDDKKQLKRIPGTSVSVSLPTLGLGLIGCIVLVVVVTVLLVAFVAIEPSSSGEENASLMTPSPTPDDAVELMDLLPKSTQEIILSDPQLEHPQSLAYAWLKADPNFDTYSEARLIQRFALAVFYFATEGPEWRHRGGEQVTLTFLGGPGGPGGPGAGPPPPSRPGPGPGGDKPSEGGAMPDDNDEPQPGGPLSQQVDDPVTIIDRAEWLDYNSHECDWYSTYPLGSICAEDNQAMTMLAFHRNDLSGSLPDELGLLSSLGRLDMHTNNVGGTLPANLPTSLVEMPLMGNKLVGSIPSDIGRLTNLFMLGIADNMMTGSLPASFWDLAGLHIFIAGGNELSGTLPEDLCERLSKIGVFKVEMSKFSGTLPASIGQCKELEWLHVGTNYMTGTLPSELGMAASMKSLVLAKNQYTGTLPSQLGLLPLLETLAVDGNVGLAGTIPAEWDALNDTLSYLDIRGTAINGTIPPWICGVKQLFYDCSPTLCGCGNCTCPL